MPIELPDDPAGMLALMRERAIIRSPFTAWLRIELMRCWQGEAELMMPVRADLAQNGGLVHGGALATLADNACCWAAASLAGPLVTANLTVHYLAPGRGDRIRALARTVRIGRRSGVALFDLHAEHGGVRTHVATGSATLSLIADR
jgi:uncharacterized protein (TIGR00369 family)